MRNPTLGKLTGFEGTPLVIRAGVQSLTMNQPRVTLDLKRVDSSLEVGDRKATNYCGDIWSKGEAFHFVITHIQGVDPEQPFDFCSLTLELFERTVIYRELVTETLGDLLRKFNHRRKSEFEPKWFISGPNGNRMLKVTINLRAFKSDEIVTAFTTLIKEAAAVNSIGRQLSVAHEQSVNRTEEILEQTLFAS